MDSLVTCDAQIYFKNCLKTNFCSSWSPLQDDLQIILCFNLSVPSYIYKMFVFLKTKQKNKKQTALQQLLQLRAVGGQSLTLLTWGESMVTRCPCNIFCPLSQHPVTVTACNILIQSSFQRHCYPVVMNKDHHHESCACYRHTLLLPWLQYAKQRKTNRGSHQV